MHVFCILTEKLCVKWRTVCDPELQMRLSWINLGKGCSLRIVNEMRNPFRLSAMSVTSQYIWAVTLTVRGSGLVLFHSRLDCLFPGDFILGQVFKYLHYANKFPMYIFPLGFSLKSRLADPAACPRPLGHLKDTMNLASPQEDAWFPLIITNSVRQAWA